jgi:hypothetical protein
MGFLAYLNRFASDSVCADGGFHATPVYVLLNIVVPLVLGALFGGGLRALAGIARLRKGKDNWE